MNNSVIQSGTDGSVQDPGVCSTSVLRGQDDTPLSSCHQLQGPTQHDHSNP